MVKGSRTVVEFRVSLEKKKTDGKVFIVHKKCSRARRSQRSLPTLHPEKTLEICRARPRLSGRSLISPWLEVESLLASSVLL